MKANFVLLQSLFEVVQERGYTFQSFLFLSFYFYKEFDFSLSYATQIDQRFQIGSHTDALP